MSTNLKYSVVDISNETTELYAIGARFIGPLCECKAFDTSVRGMDLKYSTENVTKALLPWVAHRDVAPNADSIPSRLMDPTSETTCFVKKKYPLYNIPLLPSHYYVVVDGKEFHPGAKHNPIFNDISDIEGSYVIGVEECCHHCTYHRLVKMFEGDRLYSVAFNNCQIILGENIETCALWMGIAFAVCYIVTGTIVYGIVAIVLAVFVVLRENVTASVSTMHFSACPHIKRIV